MKILFLTAIRTLTLLSFTLMQVHPAFALDKKIQESKTESKEELLSFDQVAKTISNRYNRTESTAELILMSNFDAAAEKFLLKKALEDGSYDKRPSKVKLVEKTDRVVFKFDNNMSFEIKKIDGSVWINSERLKVEKIKNIYSLYGELSRILSKKNKYSIYDLFLPKAQAQIPVVPAAWPIAAIAVILLLVNEITKYVPLLLGKEPYACGIIGCIIYWAASGAKSFIFSHDSLIENLDVRGLTCAAHAEPNPLLPTEVEKDAFGYEQNGAKAVSKFKIFYDSKGRLAKIVDGAGCEHIVREDGYFRRINHESIVVRGHPIRRNEVNTVCHFPGRIGREGGHYNNASKGYTAEKYAEDLLGYSDLVKECKKDGGLSFKKETTAFKAVQAEAKRKKEAYKAELKKENQAKEEALEKSLKPREVSQ